nr:quinonprotein alcohol dehydrogenase-like-superfamily [Tanacetum cinerariifolium]
MTQLCDIGPMLDDLKVLARCINIWKPHPANKPNEVRSLEMVFQDAQENKKSLEHLKIAIAKARYSGNELMQVVSGMDVDASRLYEDKGKTYDLNFEEENNDESRNISCGLAISIGSCYKGVKKRGPLKTKVV